VNDPQDSKDQISSQDYIAVKDPHGCLLIGCEIGLGLCAALIAIVIGIAGGSEGSFFMTLVIMLGVVLLVAIGMKRYWILASYVLTFVVLVSCAFTLCGM
jgi:hypothetical protein